MRHIVRVRLKRIGLTRDTRVHARPLKAEKILLYYLRLLKRSDLLLIKSIRYKVERRIAHAYC